MLLDILLIVASLIMLYFGANWLVNGSSSLAYRFGISPLIIGLTVVALGTSTPEMIVSIQAALMGNGGIAVGNVVGSNIFNIGIILGLTALFYPLKVKAEVLRFDIPIMLFTALLLLLFFLDYRVSRLEGAIFVISAVAYTIFNIKKARKESQQEVLEEFQQTLPDSHRHWVIDLLLMAAGLIVLIFGSDLLVNNAVSLAKSFGISDAVIGLTIVAAGTSMPELTTSIVAALKKQSDIALGNVVGSNIYNILAILGVSSLIAPMQNSGVTIADILVMVGISILLIPLTRTGFVLKRWEGLALLISFAVYMVYLWPV